MENRATVSMSQATSERMRNLRNGLLRLHKLLLDNESNAYEQVHGQVTKAQLFQLVTTHEWFAWLRPISRLIVQIDELFDADADATQADAERLINQVRKLLRPSETGEGFEKKYYLALQQDPDVILTHAEVSKLLVRGN